MFKSKYVWLGLVGVFSLFTCVSVYLAFNRNTSGVQQLSAVGVAKNKNIDNVNQDNSENNDTSISEKINQTENKDRSDKQFVVSVVGAVQNPGVYALPIGSRIADAIKKAGGVTEEANAEMVMNVLPLAKLIEDEQNIVVPFLGDKANSSSTPTANNGLQTINVNLASEAELSKFLKLSDKKLKTVMDKRPYISLQDMQVKTRLSDADIKKISGVISF